MNSNQKRLLIALAEGRMRSGESLGQELGISRAAVWKHLKALQELGIPIQATASRGYRLERPIELLDAGRIRSLLDQEELPCSLEVLDDCDSTNSELLRRARQTSIAGNVLLAEYQHHGRGRRGRSWTMPYGAGLCLSMGWSFDFGLVRLGGLSLALGIAAIDALTDCGIEDVGIKWPNDLLLGGAKLAGILLEIRGEFDGPSHVVAGIGINTEDPADQPERAGLGRYTPGRNHLAGRVIRRWMEALSAFSVDGLEPLVSRYGTLDVLADQPVRVELDGSWIFGLARGVDASGALRLECDDGVRTIAGGQVSVRRDHAAV